MQVLLKSSGPTIDTALMIASVLNHAQKTPLQDKESEEVRLRALYHTGVLDSPFQEHFDKIVELCSELCEMPIALIGFIDRDRQWNKAYTGWKIEEIPREDSFCAHAIAHGGSFYEVENAAADIRFSRNPYVTGPPYIRHYAGAPMIDSHGNALGCIAVMDRRSGSLGPKGQRLLETMAEQMARDLEVRADHQALKKSQKEMQQSIDYAKRIQSALLQPMNEHASDLPPHFSFLRPMGEVSGDFFWTREHEGYFYIAAMDCTGHGIPGAFLSMLGVSFLNEIFSENGALPPGEILDIMRARMVRELNGHDPLSGARDGMDAALIQIPLEGQQDEAEEGVHIRFAGAQNPLFVVREGIANEGPTDPYAFLPDRVRPFKDSNDGIEIRGDRRPVGYYDGCFEHERDCFSTITLQLQKGDMLYLFSDGFPDQFGGPRGKKFQYGAFKRLLTRIHQEPLQKQKKRLERALEGWKCESDEEQTDDVLVMGIRL